MRPCQKLSYDRAPLRQLLEAAVAAYVNTTHSRYVLFPLKRKIIRNMYNILYASFPFPDYLTFRLDITETL